MFCLLGVVPGNLEYAPETQGQPGIMHDSEIMCSISFISDNTKKDGHDGHGHDHGHDEHRNVITPEDVIAEHGIDGALDEDGLVNACPMLLSCQVQGQLAEAVIMIFLLCHRS